MNKLSFLIFILSFFTKSFIIAMDSESLILLNKSKPLREYSLDELMRKDIGEFEQRFNELAEDKNFDINPIFISARKQGNKPVLKFLLTKNGIDVNHKLNDGTRNALLHDVCMDDWGLDISFCEKLVTYNGIDLNIPGQDDLTALSLLAIYHPRKEYLPFFSLLLSHKADQNIADSTMLRTPLHYLSIHCESVELFKLFLNGPTTYPNKQNYEGETASDLAIEGLKCSNTVKLPHERPKTNLNIPNKKGEKPLMVNSPNTETIELLTEDNNEPKGINDKRYHNDERYPLEIVKLFLASPTVDVNKQNHKGKTPLHIALEGLKCSNTVKLHPEHPKTNLNINDKRYHNDKRHPLEIVKLFLASPTGDVNEQDHEVKTLLHIALEDPECSNTVKLHPEHPEMNIKRENDL